jgi:transposase-like protein
LIEMYVAGVSVRRVEEITEACGARGVSPSTVSVREVRNASRLVAIGVNSESDGR